MKRPKCKYCQERMMWNGGPGARYSYLCPNCHAEYKAMPGNTEGVWITGFQSYSGFLDREGLRDLPERRY